MIMGLSGVAADEGTAKYSQDIAYASHIAQINMIEEDFSDYEDDLIEEKKTEDEKKQIYRITYAKDSDIESRNTGAIGTNT